MKTLKILVFLLVFSTFILLGFVFQHTGKVVYEKENAIVTRIIDGDTIETSIGKVRLLGINTPEKNNMGYEEAGEFLKPLEGKEIELERGIENKDKYSRLLRYVFFGNKLVNKEILENGFGSVYIYEQDKYLRILRKAEEKARQLEIGIWEKSKSECADCILLVELNNKDPGEYVILGNKCEFSCSLDRWTIKDDARNTKKLDFSIEAFGNKKIEYAGRVWNDVGDSLYLRDDSGLLVLFYRY